MKGSSFDIDLLIKRASIESEYELEQALLADKKLRLLIKKNPSLKKKRIRLREIISAYESKNWSLESSITKKQIQASDEAEILVENEERFYQERKIMIKSKLKKLSLNQQEFGQILGHNSKSYISELMNGVSPFSLKDLIIINKLLKIDLKYLVFTSIPLEDRKKIAKTIKELDKPFLKFDTKEFVLS